MKEPEITCDWIDRYNDDELDEIEKALFQKRMQANPLLRSEVHIDSCLNRFLMDAEVLDLRHKIRSVSKRGPADTRLMNSLLIAASVLCLAMIGGLFYLLRTNLIATTKYSWQNENQFVPGKQKVSDQPDYLLKSLIPGDYATLSYQKGTHPGLIVKNFKPLPEFELLIGSVTRSSQVKMVSPPVNASVFKGNEVLFSWLNEDPAGSVYIVMMNNHGIPVSEIPIPHGCSYVLKTGGFRAGLYYWKIMVDDDMVLMGKLTIL